MKTKTLYTTQEVECAYDIEIEDLIDLINECDDGEFSKIRDCLTHTFIDESTWITSDNLYDEQKLKLLKTAFDKFSLEELEQRLK